MRSAVMLLILSVVTIGLSGFAVASVIWAPTPRPAAIGPIAVNHVQMVHRARLAAQARRYAQSCPAVEPGESFCGFLDGACLYCPSDKPHACVASAQCFATAEDATRACGHGWAVCSRPAG